MLSCLKNVAYDEAILYHLDENFKKSNEDCILLRFWVNKKCIILGRNLTASQEISNEYYRLIKWSKPQSNKYNNQSIPYLNIRVTNKSYDSLRIPIIRRISGGGTVLHCSGVYNYSLFIPLRIFKSLFFIKKSYNVLLGFLIKSLQSTFSHEEFSYNGLSDVTLRRDNLLKKISGNSQFRKRQYLCIHGCIIFNNAEILKLFLLLAYPGNVPDYRQGRNHNEFTTCLVKKHELTISKLWQQNLAAIIENAAKEKSISVKIIKSNKELLAEIPDLESKTQILIKDKYLNPDFLNIS